METRKITIANTRDQRKHVVMSAATTLGELKRDLDAAGINYSEMDFVEALSKTQLRGDDSVLPHDVPFNHSTTNELVFVLTTPNRKIKSGNRAEVYESILNRENSVELLNAIENYFGRNYTLVPTAELEQFVLDWEHVKKNNECASAPESEMSIEKRVAMLEHKVNNLYEAMMNTVDVLDSDYFTEDIIGALQNAAPVNDDTVYSAGMSSSDIDKLASGVID